MGTERERQQVEYVTVDLAHLLCVLEAVFPEAQSVVGFQTFPLSSEAGRLMIDRSSTAEGEQLALKSQCTASHCVNAS